MKQSPRGTSVSWTWATSANISAAGRFSKYGSNGAVWRRIAPKTGYRSTAVFEELRDARSEDFDRFGGTVSDLTYRYPTITAPHADTAEEKQRRNRLMAGLVYRLVTDTTPWDRDEQQAFMARACMTQLFPPDGKMIPEFATPPETLTWGPFEGEAWGEPYNRAITALRVMTNDYARWAERQGKSDGLRSQIVPADCTPSFMNNDEDGGTDEPVRTAAAR